MKPGKHILPLLLAALIALTAITSCRTARTAGSTDMRHGATDTWTNCQMPLKTTLRSPVSVSLGARATMERGQYIHLSFRFIGMEVAVLYLDRDSAYFVDKYHKYLFAEPLSTVLGEHYSYLTVTDLQQIILGQQKLPRNEIVTLTATDYIPTPAGDLAQQVTINSDTPQGRIAGTIDWNAGSAKWDDPGRKIRFKLPSGYKRITPSGLRNMLKSLSF